MQVIYQTCEKNNSSAIISDDYILSLTPEKYSLTSEKLDSIIQQLEYDGYFECIKSKKDGKLVNVINLKQKGKAFKREMVQRKRELFNTIFWRIIFAAIGAVVALIINKILG